MTNGDFPLKHTALYAKGWYERFSQRNDSSTIFDDLRKCFTLDNYSGEFFTDADVAEFLASKVSVLKSPRLSMAEVIVGISPSKCWQSGYYTDDMPWIPKETKVEPYNYNKAVAYYFISVLGMIEVAQLGSMPRPVYKVNPDAYSHSEFLPRPKGITDHKLDEMFGKEAANA